MKLVKTDVAIIGAGTAGMVAYSGASKRTKNVVLIEGGSYGTTCARVGCMPSKLLIAAAEAAHSIKEAPGFGVFPGGETRIDGGKVMERVKSERDRFIGFVLDAIERMPPERSLTGHARFLDDNTLDVGGHTKV
jgi:dihydrolipoamide dehydrogenase